MRETVAFAKTSADQTIAVKILALTFILFLDTKHHLNQVDNSH